VPDQRLLYTVALSVGNAQAELNKLTQIVQRTNAQLANQPAARAIATGAIEAERRLTATTRAEAQSRIAAARAEANERTQQARAAAEGVIQQERRITQQAVAEARQRAQAQRAPTVASTPPPGGTGGGLGLGGAVLGGLAGYATIQGVQEIGRQAIALSELGTQANRAEAGFRILSGGATEAARRIRAIQEAAGGTIDSLTAMQVGNQAIALGLAKTTSEFGKLTTAARAVALVSPIIHDVQGAMAELGLAAANLSFRRLDQLGLSVGEVKDRMAELQAENANLDDSQAFLAASVDILNTKYGALLQSTEAQASGFERLKVAIQEARLALAEGPVGGGIDALLGGLVPTVEAIGGTPGEAVVNWKLLLGISDLEDNIERIKTLIDPKGLSSVLEQGLRFATGNQVNQQQLLEVVNVTEQYNAAIERGVPGLEGYRVALAAIAEQASRTGSLTAENQVALDALSLSISQAESAYNRLNSANVDVNLEAFEGLDDLSKRITDAFTAADAAVRAGIPGAEEYRSAISQLAADIASGTGTMEEQSAALGELESWLTFAGDASNLLTQAQGGTANASGIMGSSALDAAQLISMLGDESLTSAEKVNILRAALAGVSALQGQFDAARRQADAAVLGASKSLIDIGGDPFAYLRQNQISDTQIKQLQAQYPDPKEFQLALAQQIEMSTAGAEAQIEAVRESERAMKRAASESEKAFKKAAQAAEDAWQDAASSLQRGLETTPGLFGSSKVTQEQLTLAEGGIPQNFADNFIRRLEAEINEKKDLFPDVSLDKAREALSRVGIIPGETVEATLIQLRQAWENSALFAHPANLELIDQAAVKENLALQEKAEQGRKNIYQFFASTIDAALKPFLPGGEGLEKPSGLPEGYTVDADGNVTAPQGAWAGIDQDKLEQIQQLPNKIIETALTQVDQALAGTGGIGGAGGLTGGLAAGVEGAPPIQGLTGGVLTISTIEIAPDALESALAGLSGGINEENQAMLEGIGDGMAQFIDVGLIGYDFAPAATSIITNLRSGFATEDNLDKLIGIGDGFMEFIRQGMSARAGRPEFAEDLVNILVSAFAEQLQEALANG